MNKEEIKEKIWSETKHIKIETDKGNFDLIDVDYYIELLDKYSTIQSQLDIANNELKEVKELWKEYVCTEEYCGSVGNKTTKFINDILSIIGSD